MNYYPIPEKIRTLIVYSTCILFGHSVNGQMGTICSKLPEVKWHDSVQNTPLTIQQKIENLALLPEGDSVQFELPDYDAEQYPDDPRYFALDTAGLYYLDLDFDGDLDLLYSGQSGWQNVKDTKVFMNDGSHYQFLKVISGHIIDFRKQEDRYEIVTLWLPCCDSYTSRIEKYQFSDNAMSLIQSIAIIGKIRLSATPDFDNLKSGYIDNAGLYAWQDDFRGTSPYFKNDNTILRDSLRAGSPIQLIKLEGQTKVGLIDKKQMFGQEWYLVVTEAINSAPISLYEWSAGDNRRFIGWVNKINLD